MDLGKNWAQNIINLFTAKRDRNGGKKHKSGIRVLSDEASEQKRGWNLAINVPGGRGFTETTIKLRFWRGKMVAKFNLKKISGNKVSLAYYTWRS